MAKRQSFADKASKKAHVKICPICNSALNAVRLVDPAFTSDKKSWKFKDKIVEICKCNEKDILG
jgi:phage FluMu protein Com